jgi:hypothetical protein
LWAIRGFTFDIEKTTVTPAFPASAALHLAQVAQATNKKLAFQRALFLVPKVGLEPT